MPLTLAWIGIVVAIIVMVLAVFVCLVGLPGSVVVLLVAFALSLCTGWQRPAWWVILIFIGLTGLAETGDNVLTAWGTKKYGGSTKGAFWSLIGGVAGAIVGGNVGPLIGLIGGPVASVAGGILGPLICAPLGGFLGGYWYELRQGKTEEEARKAGWGAFLGRSAGGLLRALIAGIMTGLTIWMLFRNGGPFPERPVPRQRTHEVQQRPQSPHQRAKGEPRTHGSQEPPVKGKDDDVSRLMRPARAEKRTVEAQRHRRPPRREQAVPDPARAGPPRTRPSGPAYATATATLDDGTCTRAAMISASPFTKKMSSSRRITWSGTAWSSVSSSSRTREAVPRLGSSQMSV